MSQQIQTCDRGGGLVCLLNETVFFEADKCSELVATVEMSGELVASDELGVTGYADGFSLKSISETCVSEPSCSDAEHCHVCDVIVGINVHEDGWHGHDREFP